MGSKDEEKNGEFCCVWKNRICLAEYLSAKVSDPSEVPRFAGKLISDLRALDNIVLVRTSDGLVQKKVFLIFF